MNIRALAVGTLIALGSTASLAQPPEGEDVNRKTTYQYTPTKENLEAREWFQDARFGLFVLRAGYDKSWCHGVARSLRGDL